MTIFKENKTNFKKSLCNRKSSIKDAMISLNKSGSKICLIHDRLKLLGTVTDGDIRKAILSKRSLNESVIKIMNKNPIKIKRKLSKIELMDIMNIRKVDHLPIVNNKGIIHDLFTRSEIEKYRNNNFVIMAGGYGSRLKPYTKSAPKPLLKIKNKEMISYIIDSALRSNFKNFIITTFYKKNMIKKFLNKKYDLNFDFPYEKKPLGTAGALSLIKKPQQDFLVVNCDIITNINYSEVLDFHKNNNADVTIVLKKIQTKNPFGEVELNGIEVKELFEKKITEHFVNAGIYVFSKKIFKELKKK